MKHLLVIGYYPKTFCHEWSSCHHCIFVSWYLIACTLCIRLYRLLIACTLYILQCLHFTLYSLIYLMKIHLLEGRASSHELWRAMGSYCLYSEVWNGCSTLQICQDSNQIPKPYITGSICSENKGCLLHFSACFTASTLPMPLLQLVSGEHCKSHSYSTLITNSK